MLIFKFFKNDFRFMNWIFQKYHHGYQNNDISFHCKFVFIRIPWSTEKLKTIITEYWVSMQIHRYTDR